MEKKSAFKPNVHSVRKQVNDVFGNQSSTIRRMTGIVFTLSVACVILAGISVYFSRKVSVVPYVVQVDEHGYEVKIGPLQAPKVIDERIIISRLGTFVTNWRSVVADVRAQQGMVEWVYSGIPKLSNANTKINQWYMENDPYRSYYETKVTRQVDVKTILKVSDTTWRLEWNETDYLGGNMLRRHAWTGLFTVGVTPSTDLKEVIKNPLGIYVTEFSVSPDFKVQGSN